MTEAPLYNIAEVLADPQVSHLGLTEEMEHPKAGKLSFVAGPVNYGTLAKEKSKPPPQDGENTRAILSELAYGQTAIEELAPRGVTKLLPD